MKTITLAESALLRHGKQNAFSGVCPHDHQSFRVRFRGVAPEAVRQVGPEVEAIIFVENVFFGAEFAAELAVEHHEELFIAAGQGNIAIAFGRALADVSDAYDGGLVPASDPRDHRHDALGLTVLCQVDIHVRQRIGSSPAIEVAAVSGPLNDLQRGSSRPFSALPDEPIAFVFVSKDAIDFTVNVFELLFDRGSSPKQARASMIRKQIRKIRYPEH